MSGDQNVNPISEWTSKWGFTVTNVMVRWLAEVESTNSFAKDDFIPPEPPRKFPAVPIIYVANHQTAGRGRGTNQWTDSEGAFLSTFSFDAKKSPQPILVPLTGLALFLAASQTWPGMPWSLKAPNDIYLGDKKVAGILIEAIERGNDRRVMIGIGMNVISHPASVPTATSLASHLSGETVSQKTWSLFLNRLFDGLKSTVIKGQAETLSLADADAIREALNRRPGLAEPIQKVGPMGELHSKSGITDWHKL